MPAAISAAGLSMTLAPAAGGRRERAPIRAAGVSSGVEQVGQVLAPGPSWGHGGRKLSGGSGLGLRRLKA